MLKEYRLDSVEKAVKLSNLCHRYSNSIDVKSGRYVVCGSSLLGVESLIGSNIRVDYFGEKDGIEAKRFYKELDDIFNQ